jgi:hypothetical protein
MARPAARYRQVPSQFARRFGWVLLSAAVVWLCWTALAFLTSDDIALPYALLFATISAPLAAGVAGIGVALIRLAHRLRIPLVVRVPPRDLGPRTSTVAAR